MPTTRNVFAKILRGELPCERIYEDEHTLAFMDIMPRADGHVLVIPKNAGPQHPRRRRRQTSRAPSRPCRRSRAP